MIIKSYCWLNSYQSQHACIFESLVHKEITEFANLHWALYMTLCIEYIWNNGLLNAPSFHQCLGSKLRQLNGLYEEIASFFGTSTTGTPRSNEAVQDSCKETDPPRNKHDEEKPQNWVANAFTLSHLDGVRYVGRPASRVSKNHFTYESWPLLG